MARERRRPGGAGPPVGGAGGGGEEKMTRRWLDGAAAGSVSVAAMEGGGGGGGGRRSRGRRRRRGRSSLLRLDEFQSQKAINRRPPPNWHKLEKMKNKKAHYCARFLSQSLQRMTHQRMLYTLAFFSLSVLYSFPFCWFYPFSMPDKLGLSNAVPQMSSCSVLSCAPLEMMLGIWGDGT